MAEQEIITKELSVHCACPAPGQPPRGFVLRAIVPLDARHCEPPWPKCLDEDADRVVEALTHGLPQGTLDRVTAKLMQRISSDLILSFEHFEKLRYAGK